MIGKLTGRIIENTPPVVVLDVNGVGYEVEVPMSVLGILPDQGGDCTLYTHFVVREDAQLLYGFSSRPERELFRLLLKVNGVGPKLAVAILSHMTVMDFVHCVADNDVVRLTKMPGVGKKTAERLLIEMRDRLKDWGEKIATTERQHPQQAGDYRQDRQVEEAEAALVALGYKPAEASKVINRVSKAGMGRNELIRQALRGMVSK